MFQSFAVGGTAGMTVNKKHIGVVVVTVGDFPILTDSGVIQAPDPGVIDQVNERIGNAVVGAVSPVYPLRRIFDGDEFLFFRIAPVHT